MQFPSNFGGLPAPQQQNPIQGSNFFAPLFRQFADQYRQQQGAHQMGGQGFVGGVPAPGQGFVGGVPTPGQGQNNFMDGMNNMRNSMQSMAPKNLYRSLFPYAQRQSRPQFAQQQGQG